MMLGANSESRRAERAADSRAWLMTGCGRQGFRGLVIYYFSKLDTNFRKCNQNWRENKLHEQKDVIEKDMVQQNWRRKQEIRQGKSLYSERKKYNIEIEIGYGTNVRLYQASPIKHTLSHYFNFTLKGLGLHAGSVRVVDYQYRCDGGVRDDITIRKMQKQRAIRLIRLKKKKTR
ncbi:hypothetical protein EVAR_6446_1 [Eumeta japonica]|uniref:Uncharacterized protein n=1 Tax=Eumeta variegata TaxID=151549 RepID=A0A4C1SSG5_EUMVA|nr:hypothetical protein EVAR_6446_1 [Eumeta japonica]